MVKIPKTWTGKKSETNPKKKEQHLNNKSRHELEHRWQEHDWIQQYQDFLEHEYQQIQE